jgi:hypothetical protein
MAFLATRFQMCSLKIEFGLPVIKCLLFQGNQFEGSPLVVGMARFATRGIYLSVEAPFLIDILLRLLVADQTFVEKHLLSDGMTFEAAPLEFLMKGRHLSRHHSLQKIDRIDRRREQKGNQRQNQKEDQLFQSEVNPV